MRCTEDIANQLLSGCIRDEETLTKTLKGTAVREDSLNEDSRYRLFTELTDNFYLKPKEASDLINLRFKSLSREMKELFRDLHQKSDAEVYSIVNAMLSTLKCDTASQEFRASHEPRRIKIRNGAQSKDYVAGLTTELWDTLDDLIKQQLLKQYMLLSSCDRKVARNRLGKKGTEDIFLSLLSSDPQKQRKALRKLDTRGGKDDELLTMTEKKVLGQYLHRLHDVKEARTIRVCSIGLRNLNVEDREKLQNLEDKDSEAYIWLADAVFKAYRLGVRESCRASRDGLKVDEDHEV